METKRNDKNPSKISSERTEQRKGMIRPALEPNSPEARRISHDSTSALEHKPEQNVVKTDMSRPNETKAEGENIAAKRRAELGAENSTEAYGTRQEHSEKNAAKTAASQQDVGVPGAAGSVSDRSSGMPGAAGSVSSVSGISDRSSGMPGAVGNVSDRSSGMPGVAGSDISDRGLPRTGRDIPKTESSKNVLRSDRNVLGSDRNVLESDRNRSVPIPKSNKSESGVPRIPAESVTGISNGMPGAAGNVSDRSSGMPGEAGSDISDRGLLRTGRDIPKTESSKNVLRSDRNVLGSDRNVLGSDVPGGVLWSTSSYYTQKFERKNERGFEGGERTPKDKLTSSGVSYGRIRITGRGKFEQDIGENRRNPVPPDDIRRNPVPPDDIRRNPVPPDMSYGKDAEGFHRLDKQNESTLKTSGSYYRHEFSRISKTIVKPVAGMAIGTVTRQTGEATGHPFGVVRDGAHICGSVFSMAAGDTAIRAREIMTRKGRNDVIRYCFGEDALIKGYKTKDVRSYLSKEFKRAGVSNVNLNLHGNALVNEARRVGVRVRVFEQRHGATAESQRAMELVKVTKRLGLYDKRGPKRVVAAKFQKGKGLIRNVNHTLDRHLQSSDAGRGYVQAKRGVSMLKDCAVTTVRTAVSAIHSAQFIRRRAASAKLKRTMKKLKKLKEAETVVKKKKITKLDKKLSQTQAKVEKFNEQRFPKRVTKRATKRATKKAPGERFVKWAAARLSQRTAGRAVLRTGRVIARVGSVLLRIGSAVSSISLWFWVAIGCAVLLIVLLIVLEQFYLSILGGAFSFEGASGSITGSGITCDIKDACNYILAQRFQEDYQKMSDYVKEYCSSGGKGYIEFIDIEDEDYYAEYMDAHESFMETSNSSELLSMVYTYYGLDMESEIGSDGEEVSLVSYQDLEDYLSRLYWISHKITASTSSSLETRTTDEMEEIVIVDDQGNEEVYSTEEVDEVVTVVNATFTYTTNYFPYLFELAESDEFETIQETQFNSYSTNGYYGSITDEQGIYVALRAAGLTHAAACGIIGNIRVESGGWEEVTQEKINAIGTSGLVGWSGGWEDDMIAFCDKNGYDPLSLSGQTQYLIDNILSEYPGYGTKSLKDLLMTSDDIQKCAEVFAVYYECCYTTSGSSLYPGAYHYAAEYPYPGMDASGGITVGSNYYAMWQAMEQRVEFAYEADEKYSAIKDTWKDLLGANDVVEAAREIVNTPGVYYLWGGNGPLGYDCSHFVHAAYEAAGYEFPYMDTKTLAAYASGQSTSSYFTAVENVTMYSWDGWQPGDIIVWRHSDGGHTAIYMGNGEIAEAASTNTGIVIRQYTSVSAKRDYDYVGCLRWKA